MGNVEPHIPQGAPRWLGGAAAALACWALAAGAATGQQEDPAPPEPPYWPIGMDLPDALKPKPEATKGPPRKGARASTPLLVWVPPGAKHIRAVFIIPNNSDSKVVGEHAAIRKAAARHEMAILYLRSLGLEGRMDDTRTLMDAVAAKTGIAEFRHAPWITLGKSSRGKFPFYMAWKFPKRTIATISYHGETPTWPPEKWARLDGETILHLSANGALEWGGTWYKHVRPSLLNYRARSAWLPHQAAAYDVGHGDYPDGHGSGGWGKLFPSKVTCIDVWDYIAVFIDKALALRVPTDKYPTDAPVALKQVDANSGCLIEPFAVEDLFQEPRLPLVFKHGSYVVDPLAEPNCNGYADIPPAKDYQPPEAVPVVELKAGFSPTNWLLTKGLGGFAMETDPMRDVSAFASLRTKPGDTIQIEGRQATFTPIADNEIGRREKNTPRGVAMHGGLQPRGRQITLIGYTVLNVKEPHAYKVTGLYSLAVRLQIVLNGRPVDHKQIVQLSKGLYPMLFVLRMKSVTWGHVEPSLDLAAPEEVAEGKRVQVDKDARRAEFEKRQAAGPRKPESFVHKASDVPAAERRRMFWVADMEQAAAWLKLQDIKARAGK